MRPGAGFPMHSHRDMEIITYVLEGALEHKDSLGNGSVIRPGEVQRMTAGTGVMHSEFNASQDESVHFLQIWIVPERLHLEPSYEQKQFSRDAMRGRWLPLASSIPKDGELTVHQNAALHGARLETGEVLGYDLAARRSAWLQVAKGMIELDGRPLQVGDGAAVTGQSAFSVRATSDADLLLFDLA